MTDTPEPVPMLIGEQVAAYATQVQAGAIRFAAEHVEETCPARSETLAKPCVHCSGPADRLRRLAENVEDGAAPGTSAPAPAVDLTVWAEQLTADQLEPAEHQFTVCADGRPITRVHFAFAPDLPDDARIGFAVAVAEIAATQTGAHCTTEEVPA